MSERVIEPSEILVDQRGTIKEDTTHANPWIRLIGRFFDYSLFFLLLWGARVLLKGQFPFGSYEHLVPFEFFVWIPIEALLLKTWGTTPGKFFLKTKLRPTGRTKLDYVSALRRSFSVWFRGLGLGIPILNALCLLVAYHRLKVFHKTSWDRDDHITVTHSPIPRWRLVIACIIAFGGITLYYKNKNQVLYTQTPTQAVHARVL